VDISVQSFLRSCPKAVSIDDVAFEALDLSPMQHRITGFSFDIMLSDVLKPKSSKHPASEADAAPSGGGAGADRDRNKASLHTRNASQRSDFNKFVIWSSDIQRHIMCGSLLASELETLVGHMEHAGYLVPLIHHFLGRILWLKDVIIFRVNHHIHLSAKIISDLHLFLVFLTQAHDRISMNMLTDRTPDHHHRADACEKGIGGYDMATGMGRRWKIPREHWGKLKLNSLEFIRSFVSFWSGILDGTIKTGV
jgi:hypothetical protein